MSLQSFRERVNVWLYDSKERVLGAFQWLTLLVNLSALSVLAVYYGYDHDAETAERLFDVVKFSFAFYVLHYGVRVLYHFHPKTFFRETWAEGLGDVVAFGGGCWGRAAWLASTGARTCHPHAEHRGLQHFFGSRIFVCRRPDGMDATWITAASRPLASCIHFHLEFCPAHRGGHLVVEHA